LYSFHYNINPKLDDKHIPEGQMLKTSMIFTASWDPINCDQPLIWETVL